MWYHIGHPSTQRAQAVPRGALPAESTPALPKLEQGEVDERDDHGDDHRDQVDVEDEAAEHYRDDSDDAHRPLAVSSARPPGRLGGGDPPYQAPEMNRWTKTSTKAPPTPTAMPAMIARMSCAGFTTRY